tara:strand:- start:3000 stop:3206 length:207 start_codon:yes stop_codon:yes gene_type:complete
MNQEEQRKINYLLKNKELPKHINKKSYGKLLLDNIVNQQIEEEMGSTYDSFFGKPKSISEEYDLGNWS